MSPLRLTNRRPGDVGAPLVTPADDLAEPNRRPGNVGAPLVTPVNRLTRPPTDWRNQTAAVPHIPACHPGDMNVAPTIDWTPSPGKRRGATCDARQPIDTPADGLAESNCRAEVSRKTICALLFVRSVAAHGAKLRRFRALLISQKASIVSPKAQIFLHDTDNRNNFAVWQRRKNWKSYIPHGSN